MEKTTECKLLRSELVEMRRRMTVCSKCGTPFVRDEDSDRVCEPCVKKAMEKEGFAYAKRTWAEV